MKNIRISNAQIERVFFYIVLSGIFLFLSTSYFLPMCDLPQHAGQIQALKAIITGQTDAPWFDAVEINFLTPYWIGYLLGLVLSFFMPVNYAVNTEVGIVFLLFVLAFSHLRKRFNGDSLLDWFLIPAFFSLCFRLGFLTFLLAIPVGVLLLIQNLNWLDTQNRKYAIRTLLVGIVLYFSHMLIFLLFCGICGGMTIVDNRHTIKNKLKLLWPFYALSLLIPFFLLTTEFFSTSYIDQFFQNTSSTSPSLINKLLILFGHASPSVNNFDFVFLFKSTSELTAAVILLIVIITIIPRLIGCKITKDLKRYIPFGAFLGAYFLLPASMGKTWLIFDRFSVFAFPFYILLFEKNAPPLKSIRSQLKTLFSCILVLGSLFLTNISISTIQKFNGDMADFKNLLIELPEKKRALNIFYKEQIFQNQLYSLHMNAYLIHFASWYQALKQGWVDFNFAWYPPQVIRFKENHYPEINPLFEFSPDKFTSLKNCDVHNFIIVYLTTNEQLEYHDALMKQSTCRHQLKYQKGSWFVYSLE